MNRFVHQELTRRWALDEGFSAQDAEEIARWNWQVDVGWPGRPWRNKPYHHRMWGAMRLAREYFAHAVSQGSLPHLGVALHIEQDAISHGWLGSVVHWPGIDRWERRSRRVRRRVEGATRATLAAYRRGRGAGGGTVGSRPGGDLPLPRG